MRVLLDECIPRKLQYSFTGHECRTVYQAGLAGRKNGELLVLAEAAGYDVLVTVDTGIPQQQNWSDRKIALLIIHAPSNEIEDLLPHAPACLLAVESILPGSVVHIRS